MITEIIKLLPNAERGKLTDFAKGKQQYPMTFIALFNWIKKQIR